MKNTYLSIICLLVTGILVAQQSNIFGKIIEADTGDPIIGASIYLLPVNINKGTTSNLTGNYTLENIPEGEYTIHVSYIGYETITTKITLKSNESTEQNYTLEEALFELQDVEIVGRKRTNYKPDVTFAGTKVGANIKDVPQSIAIINKEVLKDQGLFRLNEVTENVAGVTRTRAGNNFTSRGFRIGHDFVNGNRALLAPDFAGSAIATQYERIEFIKGPAAALFGNSSPGGVVNAVTKKPLKENRADASISIGGFTDIDDIAIKRATLDITGPLNKEKTLLYRTNVAWESSEEFSDFIKTRSNLFAPSLSYLPNNKTRFNIDIVGSFNNDRAGIYRGIPVLQNDLLALPINYNAAEPYDNRQNSSLLYTFSATHKFSDAFILNASYTRSDFNQNFIETRSSNTFTADGTELQRRINDRKTLGSSDFATAYLISNFKTGPLSHKAILGLDYYETMQESETRAAVGEANGVPNLTFNNRIPISSITELSLAFSETPVALNSNALYRGVYLQDLIEVGKFKVLAALRYEKLGQVNTIVNGSPTDALDDDVFLPRFGLTYTLNEQINLYASYTEGFQRNNIPALVNVLEPGQEFHPHQSDQIEIGTKASFFKDKLLAQVSLYTINRSGRILADASGASFNAIQLGTEISRGTEIEVTGKITSHITLTANYAFNDVEFDDEDLAVLERISGALSGTTLVNNPKHTAGFWGKYTFKNDFLRNFGIGLGGRFVSENQIDNTALNRSSDFLLFPSYFTLKQGIFYRNKNIDVTLNINNILDERYYIGGIDVGRVFPGAPRNFLLTAGYKF